MAATAPGKSCATPQQHPEQKTELLHLTRYRVSIVSLPLTWPVPSTITHIDVRDYLMACPCCIADSVYVKANGEPTIQAGMRLLWLSIIEEKQEEARGRLSDYQLCIEVETNGFGGWMPKEPTSLKRDLGSSLMFRGFLGTPRKLGTPENNVIICTPPRPPAAKAGSQPQYHGGVRKGDRDRGGRGRGGGYSSRWVNGRVTKY